MKALKFIAAAAVAAALAVSCNTSSNPKVDVELPTSADIDSVSYLIGVNFGSFIKGNNFAAELSELNMSQIKKGMEDFLKAIARNSASSSRLTSTAWVRFSMATSPRRKITRLP